MIHNSIPLNVVFRFSKRTALFLMVPSTTALNGCLERQESIDDSFIQFSTNNPEPIKL